MTTANDVQTRLEWIRTRRERTEAAVAGIRRSNTRVVYTSLLTSTAATALAGYAAAAGVPTMGGWRLTCAVVAVLTFVATVASGLQRQLDFGGRQARFAACAGKLAALEYAASLGTRPLAEIDADCEALMREFPEVFS